MYFILLSLAQFFYFTSAAPSDCLNGIEEAISKFVFAEEVGPPHQGLCQNEEAISKFVFAGEVEPPYQSLCQNNLSLFSMWAAAKVYCITEEQISAGEQWLRGYCTGAGFDLLVPYATLLPNLTDDAIAALPVVDFADTLDTTHVRNTSVLISEALYDTGKKTIVVLNDSMKIHKKYGWGVYGFWGGILLIGIIDRLINFLLSMRNSEASDQQRAIEAQSARRSHSTVFSKTYRWFQANLILPPAIGTHHQRYLFGFTMPTRIVALIIIAYYIWSILICTISYDVFYPNFYYNDYSQGWHYVAARTGTLSYANLPVMWIFAGRNNIFLWATGWDFSTFSIFHRHIGIVATVQAIVHAIACTVEEFADLEYWDDWKDQYWYMGAVSLITMSLILVFSSSFLRQKSYELFLVIHIVLALVTLIGLFFHTKIFTGEFEPYLYPIVAIWCFDRLLRLLRQLHLNIRISPALPTPTTTHSTTEYRPAANLLILTITLPAKRLSKTHPNSHFFLYQPFQLRGWENHPFTAVVQDEQTMCFYIRPQGKFTARLMRKRYPRLIVEGPYGGKGVRLQDYDTVLLVAGGSGVSATISYLKSFLFVAENESANAGVGVGKKIRFLWAAKEEALVREIVARELAAVADATGVEIEIFVTGAKAQVGAVGRESP
ncbi:putative ferric reductase transmembrane component [Lachnellula willkommii]|uniref:Putative ferric reductase transmembrane component n=1 Tax=Lachnellula willkommii TaxID=215461 RepID=A0A559MEC7_9HELO|nr:putative ferric reductase transmembrane component [Lachnellula willkommii]